MGVFDFLHDEGGQDAADGVDRTQHVDDEFVVVFHVGRMDLQQVVVLAGNVVALGHLGDFLDDGNEAPGRVAAHLLEFDGAEDDKAEIQFLRIQHGDVLFDEAAALQPFQAFEDGGGGEVDAGGQLLGGQAGVLLQAAQDGQVGGVEALVSDS